MCLIDFFIGMAIGLVVLGAVNIFVFYYVIKVASRKEITDTDDFIEEYYKNLKL